MDPTLKLIIGLALVAAPGLAVLALRLAVEAWARHNDPARRAAQRAAAARLAKQSRTQP